MCFSAQASIIAAISLAIIGAACMRKAKTASAYLLTAIPLLFAVQQFAEAFVWLSQGRDWPHVQHIATYGYLFFALFVWPMWIPITLRAIEHTATRTQQLTILSMLGMLVGTYLYQMAVLYGVSAQALDCHIYYALPYTWPEQVIASVLYLMCTVVPFFVSSLPIMWGMGLMVASAYVVSYFFYYTYLTSVWCFFAAIISGFVYVVLLRLEKKKSL